MSAPLNHGQKAYLSQLSDQAFTREQRIAASMGIQFYEGMSPTKAREAFRHAEVAKACAKIGLRCCTQDDYKLVEAHFLQMLGKIEAAFKAGVRAASEPRRQAEAVLVRECTRFGFRLSYAESICRTQYKCTLQDATTNQIWNLVYTVRNRGNARNRKAA